MPAPSWCAAVHALLVVAVVSVCAAAWDVHVSTASVECGALLEVCSSMPYAPLNPFDYTAQRYVAHVTPLASHRHSEAQRRASVQAFDVEGFAKQDFTRTLSADERVEQLVPRGAMQWCARHAFVHCAQAGDADVRKWSISVTLERSDNASTLRAGPVVVQVLASASAEADGYVTVADRSRMHFATSVTQRTVFPVGECVCWADRNGTYDYDVWLSKLSAVGGNYARLWLDYDSWFDVETEATGVGRYSSEALWRVDYVVETLGTALGMRFLLSLDSFNSLRASDPFPFWSHNPYNSANGGPIDKPEEFFTDAYAQAFFLNRLRYLVARFGYSTHVFAWELWNEVDIVEVYDPKTVSAWHARMATALKMMDGARHMVSTSFSFSPGDPGVDALPELDFTQTHTYNAHDFAADAWSYVQLKHDAYAKPTFLGEFGLGDPTQSTQSDPTGIYLHNGLWASLASGAAAGAMTWWWDNYVDPQDLYYRFAAFAKFVEALPLAEHAWQSWHSRDVPLDVFGMLGDEVLAFVWLHNTNYTWFAQNASTPLELVGPGFVPVQGLRAGAYAVRCMDTNTGAWLAPTRAASNGTDTLWLPFTAFRTSLACVADLTDAPPSPPPPQAPPVVRVQA